jgi:lysyl-tRNA synthetase class 2
MEPNWKMLKTDVALRDRLLKRSQILAEIRHFFDSHGFQEVETPLLVAKPGMEPNLDVFATKLKSDGGASWDGFLITSPEYSMKKLLAAGYGRIYTITKTFRNAEPLGGSHNPEFTMIEWYRADADYRDIMRDTEEMAAKCAERACGSTRITWQGREVDLSIPWPRLTVAEALMKYSGIDLGAGIDDPDRFRREAAVQGIDVGPGDSFDDIFFKLFLRDVESRLGEPDSPGKPWRPVIVHDYPRSMAALARLKDSDRRYAERFEAYCLGLELGNAFSELNDATEQRARLEEESVRRRAAGKVPWEIDGEFVEAIGMMPKAGGIALGVDRLVMLLTDAPTIRDVLFFPASDLFK